MKQIAERELILLVFFYHKNKLIAYTMMLVVFCHLTSQVIPDISDSFYALHLNLCFILQFFTWNCVEEMILQKQLSTSA